MKPVKKRQYSHHLQMYTFAANHLKTPRVVDIGCGEGYGLQIISLFCEEVVGIDISNVFVRRASGRQLYCAGEIIQHNLDTHPLPIQDGDQILAFEVLEHVIGPVALLRYLSTHNHPLILSLPHNYPHPLHKTVYPDDVSVKNLLREGNYTIDTFLYYREGIFYEEKIDNVERYVVIASPTR